LYQFADENPVFTKGDLMALNTKNGRIAAFLRRHRDQIFLCIFNFPNPHHEGQQAVARTFNVMVQNDQGDASFLKEDGVYEIVERFNNTEGRTRRGYRQCWSGHELIHLGLSGMLEPVSSHVYDSLTNLMPPPASSFCWTRSGGIKITGWNTVSGIRTPPGPLLKRRIRPQTVLNNSANCSPRWRHGFRKNGKWGTRRWRGCWRKSAGTTPFVGKPLLNISCG
jgi:hypothetical protein